MILISSSEFELSDLDKSITSICSGCVGMLFLGTVQQECIT